MAAIAVILTVVPVIHVLTQALLILTIRVTAHYLVQSRVLMKTV